MSVAANIKLLLSQLWFKISIDSTTAVGTAAVFVVGGLHVLQGELQVGGLVVALAYVMALYTPVQSLAHLSGAYADAMARARRIDEVLEVKNDIEDPIGTAQTLSAATSGGRSLEFRDVSFSYDSRRQALHHVSLEIGRGKVAALVGETGAGKSTLTGLALRLFDPDGGRVLIDGIDIRELKVAELRAQFAVVLQSPYLLPLTVAENIAYGRPEATWQAIEAAAKAAGADSFVRALPQGYDTVIGERGATLSGGERQRLAIARAFLKDAPILILDEPTAALDAKMEAALIASLEKLMQGRTTLIIAHRLSTLRTADEIAVIRNGRIVETGTRDDLLADETYFKRLYDLQSGEKGSAKLSEEEA
jgi:ATP-binding cassette subfamily B protein/subfamily B ATP-binding cassette protein MsbA